MPKANPEPDPNRRQTRSKNAFAHPGKIVLEANGKRKPEEIENEKKERNERQKAKAKKKTHIKANNKDIAQFEHQMVLDDKAQEARIPRHETDVEAHDKKRDRSTNAAKKRKKKVAQLSEHDGVDTEPEDESESVRKWYSKLKKQKIVEDEPVPLRQTETYLTPDNFKLPPVAMLNDSTPKPAQKMKQAVGKALSKGDGSDVESEADEERGFEYSKEGFDTDQVESEDEDFVMPKALRKCLMIPSESDLSDRSSAESGEGQESDRIADVQSEERMKSGNMDQSKPHLEWDLQTPKRIDLSKVQRNDAQLQEKRAPHKEVEERRTVVVKETSNKILRGSQGDKPISGQKSDSDLESAAETYKVSTVAPRAQLVTSKHAPVPAPHASSGLSGLNQRSRNSATSGNKVSVSTTTHTVTSRKPRSNSKANGMEEMTVSLSDEDDGPERDAISKSPAKGMQRLSSEAIVKVEKPTSKTRTRSKKAILGTEILTRWSQHIEPNLFYRFFYELSPWPSTGDLVACAQNLWDWRFGDSHPLDFATNPRHLALLNQKLCEIRNGLASIAIANVDIEFRIANKIDLAATVPPDEGMEDLRQAYAEGLLEDKKFVFGKYVVARNTEVRKSQPYRSGLLLRTFQYGFKYLKDVNKEAPLPESRYPITLLAISAAAVERALTLTIDKNYDFELRKLIPKADPGHPSGKLTTSMFSFSETVWKPRTMVYRNNILKLKEKDWEKILEAASNISKSPRSAVLLKGKEPVTTTKDEMELAWGSDSD